MIPGTLEFNPLYATHSCHCATREADDVRSEREHLPPLHDLRPVLRNLPDAVVSPRLSDLLTIHPLYPFATSDFCHPHDRGGGGCPIILLRKSLRFWQF